MSLGLFNCRLIQPAGDQLFFFSAALPRRCQFGQALFSLLVTRPARPRPTGGRRMLLVFPSQKDFVLVFRGAKSPRAQKGSLPTIHPRISPKIPQSYPQIPLQTPLYINPSHHNGRPIAGCQWSPDLKSDARANSTKTRPSSCQEGPAWYQPHNILSNGRYSSNARRSSTGITMVMVFFHGNLGFSQFSTCHSSG